MADKQRVVAELGRPETAEETAARKAESSRIYRSSQSFRNLIAAMIVTVAVVAVIALMVPRGNPTVAKETDAVAIAEEASATLARPFYAVTELPSDWQTNAAERKADGKTGIWRVVYSPDKDSKTPGFVNLEQSFNSDEDRVIRVVPGAEAGDEVTIDGWTWTNFTISGSSEQNKNVTSALGTQVGDDYVLLYGNADESFVRDFAANLTAQFDAQ